MTAFKKLLAISKKIKNLQIIFRKTQNSLMEFWDLAELGLKGNMLTPEKTLRTLVAYRCRLQTQPAASWWRRCLRRKWCIRTQHLCRLLAKARESWPWNRNEGAISFLQKRHFRFLGRKSVLCTEPHVQRLVLFQATQRYTARRAAVPTFFERGPNLNLVNIWRPKPQTAYEKNNDCIVRIIFGNKLLSSFLMSAIDSFLKYIRYRQRRAVATLKIYNTGLDCLDTTHFLTFRYPYCGNHWRTGCWKFGHNTAFRKTHTHTQNYISKGNLTQPRIRQYELTRVCISPKRYVSSALNQTHTKTIIIPLRFSAPSKRSGARGSGALVVLCRTMPPLATGRWVLPVETDLQKSVTKRNAWVAL